MAERDGVVFYRSFWEAITHLDDADQLASVKAIVEYGLYGKEPECSGVATAIFMMAKPQIDANNRRYENGTKGGRPKTDDKEIPRENQKKPSANQAETYQEPKEKEKVKDKVKEKENKKDIVPQAAVTPPKTQRVYQYSEVIGYLNEKAGTSFRSSARDSQSHIKARFDEGYTLTDFKTVIDKKVEEWGREPAAGEKDMRQYLRPATLFGTKFESYLNQPVAKPKTARFCDHMRSGDDYDAVVKELYG